MENKTVSDAAFLKRLVGVMWTFYIVAIVAYGTLGPLNIVSMFCLAVTGVLLIVNVVLLIRWRIRYHSIPALDGDLKQAKRNWNISLVLCFVMMLLGIIPVLLSILFPVKT